MPALTDGTRLHRSSIDLKEDVRVKLVALLNASLATATDLKTQTKFAHWNVKGPQFQQLHLLFDETATLVDGYVDLIAERATTLGGVALGTARLAAAHSALPEYPIEAAEGQQHLEALVARLAIFGKHVREAIAQSADLGDQSTSDLYTEVSRGVDKQLWFLEAHLQAKA